MIYNLNFHLYLENRLLLNQSALQFNFALTLVDFSLTFSLIAVKKIFINLNIQYYQESQRVKLTF